MRPLAPRLLAVAAIAAATSLLPLPAAADALSRYYKLADDLDPSKSAAVLKDTEFLKELHRQNRDAHDHLVKKEGVLLDLAEALEAARKEPEAEARVRFLRKVVEGACGAVDVRDSLFSRHDLGPEPARLGAWVRRHFDDGLAADMEAALLSWGTLPKAAKDSLERRGLNESAWHSRTFAQRTRAMGDYASERLEAIEAALKENPRGEALKAIDEESDAVAGFLPHEKQPRARQVGRVLQLHKNLALAEKDPAILRDPALQSMLATASNSGKPMDERLGALARLFDKRRPAGGEPSTAVDLRRLRESPPDGRLDQEQAALLADMLRPALLEELKGTVVGDQVRDFYAKNGLKLSVSVDPDDAVITHLAQYNSKTRRITVAGRAVETWLKGRDRPARDLQRDPELFKEFVADTAPIFVHEAFHDMTYAEMPSRGVKRHHRGLEMHADFMMAAFSAEKRAGKAGKAGKEGRSSFEETNDALAREFLRGPRAAQQFSMVHRYGDEPGPAFLGAESVAHRAKYREILVMERERRRTLSDDALREIADEGLSLTGFEWGELDEFKRNVRRVRGPVLEELMIESSQWSSGHEPYEKTSAYAEELRTREAGTWVKVMRRVEARK